MTLEFAEREAQRRTLVLRRTHYVIYASIYAPDSWADMAYLVSDRKPETDRHVVVSTIEFKQ